MRITMACYLASGNQNSKSSDFSKVTELGRRVGIQHRSVPLLPRGPEVCSLQLPLTQSLLGPGSPAAAQSLQGPLSPRLSSAGGSWDAPLVEPGTLPCCAAKALQSRAEGNPREWRAGTPSAHPPGPSLVRHHTKYVWMKA